MNVYPRATIGDESYLLNRTVPKLEISKMSDAYQILFYLSRQMGPPQEQIGYKHVGGDVLYEKPWTTMFHNLTVRQIVNRATARLGPHGGWLFYGARDARWFTFHKVPGNPPESTSKQAGKH